MSKVLEKRVAEIIVITVITVVLLGMSSCGSTKQLEEKPVKECCKKTAQAVYEYEGLIVK